MIRAMANSDSAFLWETEAIRSTRRRARTTASPGRHEKTTGDDWKTLKDASAATGIPVPTLRKWARKESVPSYLEDTALGQLRMVSMTGVLARAKELGREVDVEESETKAAEPQKSKVAEPAVPSRARTKESEVTPVGFSPSPSDEPDVPPGTMLVPIDAWDKMLLQLGNLHEAGQQLAEARERAGKAETEAKFLRERLSEMRTELAEAKAVGTAKAVEPPNTSEPEATPEPRPMPPPEPIAHIPIETPDEADASQDGRPKDTGSPEPSSEDDDHDIPVRDLGKREDTPTPSSTESDDDSLTLTDYSLRMINHIYSTWRARPRR